MRKIALLLFSLSLLWGTDYTWNLNANGNWSATANWTPSTGRPSGSADTATFGSVISAARTITVDTTGFGADVMTFNATNSYIISGANSLSLGGGTGTPNISISASNASGTISAPIAIAGSVTIDQNSPNPFTLSGTISGTGDFTKTGVGTLIIGGTPSFTGTLNINNGSVNLTGPSLPLGKVVVLGTGTAITFDMSGIAASVQTILLRGGDAQTTVNLGAKQLRSIGASAQPLNAVIIGTGSITYGGNNILTLGGSNSYSGGTSITNSIGVIQITQDSNLGDPAGTFTFSGGTLNTKATFTMTRPFSLSFANINTDSSTTLTLNGTLSSGGLTKIGAGTLILGGSSSYSGGTTITAGLIQISAENNLGSSAGTLTFNGGTFQTTATFTSTRPVVLTSTGSIQTNSSTTLTLNGTVSGASALVKTGSGTLVLGGSNSYSGGTTISAGMIQTSAENNLGALAGTLTFNGGSFGTTATFTTTRSFVLSSTGTIQTDPSTTLTMNGTISSTGGLAKSGAGTLILGLANTYSGGTTIAGGTIQVSADNNMSDPSGTITFDGGGLLTTNSFTTTRPIVLASTGTIQPNETLTLTGTISGTGSFAKAGAGLLTLSGSNSYSGGTSIIGGTLQVSGSNNLGSSVGTLTFNGGTLNTTATFTTTRPYVLNATGTLNIDFPTTLTVNGTVSGSSVLAKTGGGTLVLGGSSSYSGGTTIVLGTIVVGADNNLGNSAGTLTFNAGTLETTATFTSTRPVVLTATGTIQTDSSTTLTLNGTISSTGSLSKIGAGTLVLGGSSSYSGGTTIAAGTIQISAENNLGDSAGTLTFNGGALNTTATFTSTRAAVLSATGTVQTDSSTTFTMNGTVSSTGALVKTGSGTMVLGGSNSYSGGTTIAAGTLQVGTNANLGNSSGTVTFNGGTLNTTATFATTRSVVLSATGTLQTNSSTTLTLNGTISSTGALAKNGTGSLILGGTNSYTGGTLLYSGTTTLTGSLATTGNLTFGTGTTIAFDMSAVSQTVGTLSGGDSQSTLNLGNQTLTTDSSASSTFAGNIIGSNGVFIKQRSGTLILTGTNTYSGGTTVSAGTLQGNTASIPGPIINNSTLTFNQTFSGTYSGAVSGTGALRVQGGSLLFLSDTSTVTQGSATVLSTGILSVNGALSADTTIQAGGTLQGTGIITGNVRNSGTVAPGNSIGTLTIIGDYTQPSGGELDIEFDPSSADLLIVQGDVHLQSGSILSLFPTLGTYAPNQIYTIVDPTGVVNGTFSTVNISLPTFLVDVLYLPSAIKILLNVAPFTDLDLNKNARAVANCLTTTSNSDLNSIINDLRFMSVDQLNQTLDQMGPSIFNTLDLEQETGLFQIRETLSRQMKQLCNNSCAPFGTLRLWTDYFSSHVTRKPDPENFGYKARPRGDATGIDYTFDCAFAGFAYGYGTDRIYWNDLGGKGSLWSNYFSLYAGGQINPFAYTRAALIASYDSYKVHRNISFVGDGEAFTPFTRTAR